jgi:O-acetyl-ADP-ribose deacetylase (regulator of RNase III)
MAEERSQGQSTQGKQKRSQMKEIGGNILDKTGIICHQVNCQGKMGAGLALQIKRKWPIVYKEYLKALDTGLLYLGEIQFVRVSPKIIVCNMAAQDRYGRDKRYTDYGAFAHCLLELRQRYQKHLPLPVCFPHGIGCANAGGDWEVISALIEDIIPEAYIVNFKGE